LAGWQAGFPLRDGCQAHNLKVVGSNPTPATKQLIDITRTIRPPHGRSFCIVRSCRHRVATKIGPTPNDAIRLGAIGFDAVKQIVLARIEKRPARLDLAAYLSGNVRKKLALAKAAAERDTGDAGRRNWRGTEPTKFCQPKKAAESAAH
jgi:hypothetical protein